MATSNYVLIIPYCGLETVLGNWHKITILAWGNSPFSHIETYHHFANTYIANFDRIMRMGVYTACSIWRGGILKEREIFSLSCWYGIYSTIWSTCTHRWHPPRVAKRPNFPPLNLKKGWIKSERQGKNCSKVSRIQGQKDHTSNFAFPVFWSVVEVYNW